MAKKRKTPAQPRAPHDDLAGARVMGRQLDRDTDEQYLGEVHPDFVDETGAVTRLEARPGLGDEELLDPPIDPPLRPRTDAEYSYEELRIEPPGAVPVERRLTPTLLRIFARRRRQIRLSLEQLARLSGISLELLVALDETRPGQTITFDQAVVLARVLGVPADELPGLRRREAPTHLGRVLAELERTMLSAPLLRFEGQHGERYGGDVERAASGKAFTVRIEDGTLDPALPRGSLLGFLTGTEPRRGGVVLLRHRRSALLAMRRNEPPSYLGVSPWQPSYVVGGEWHHLGCLEVVLPSR